MRSTTQNNDVSGVESEKPLRAIEFSPDGSASAKDIPRPVAGPGEAVIRVTSAGVCGSDYSALHGTHPFRTPPLISGHEVGGVIAELGEPGPEDTTASLPSVGDAVVIDPQWPCQTCTLCRRGDYHLCPDKTMLGVASWDGGLADYVKVPTFTLVKAPAELDHDLLSFAEPMAVAVHAVRRAGSVTPAEVLVLGGGTIGTLITAVLTAETPGLQVTVVEPREHLHELVEIAGATRCVTSVDDAPERGFDLVFIAAGVPALVEASVRAARTGGTVVQVAVFGSSQPAPVGDLQMREITMVGTATYTKVDIADALDIVLAKIPLVQRMVTYTDDWDDAAARITAIAADGPGDVLKLIVRGSVPA